MDPRTLPLRRSIGLLLGLSIGLLATGCRIAEAKVWNLEQLHRPDGRPRRQGVLQSDFEFALRRPLEQVLSRRLRGGEAQGADEGEAGAEPDQGGTTGFFGSKPSRIRDPYTKCLENLRGLEGCDSGDPNTLALQAQFFSWLAVKDTYVLSREEAVLGLAEVGRRMGVVELALLPEQGAEASEVAGTLSQLLRAARPVLRSGRGALGGLIGRRGAAAPDAPEDQAALDAACGAVRDQVRDFEGERRAFAVLTTLLRRVEGRHPELVRLHQDLGRRVVAHALATAAGDASPLVRRAALESAVRIRGLRREELERGLADPEAAVLAAVLDLVAEQGLPEPGGLVGVEPAEAEALRIAWTERIVAASQRSEGPVIVAACRALARLAGGVDHGLRPEGWIDWWTEVGSRSRVNPADEAPASAPR